MIIGYAFAIAIPLVVLYVIWSMEIYSLVRNHVLIASFLWGMGAFLVALIIQNNLLTQGLLTYDQVVLFSAPILEEFLKVGLLIMLVRRMSLRYAIDGTAYGFAIGTGFAIAENLFYISLNDGSVLSEVLIRVFSVSLMHAFTSAIVGTVIGANSYHGARVRIPRTVFAIVGVMILHGAFNFSVTLYEDIPLILMSTALGIGSTLILMTIIQGSLTIEKNAIERQLNLDMSDGELQAMLKPADLATIIRENIDSVGERRAKLIYQYVGLQSQRGILMKTLSLNQRTKFNRVLEQKLELLEAQLTTLRGEMGLYNWVWLRSVLPSEESELWTKLDIELDTENSLLNLLVELNKRQLATSDEIIEKRTKILGATTLFSGLKGEDLKDLALLLREQRYSLGDITLTQNQHNQHLFIVETGTFIASVFDDNGTETVVSTFSDGDYFGELSMLDNTLSPMQVMAVDECVIHTLSSEDFIMLVYAKPDVGLAMMRQLASDIRQRTALVAWVNQTSTANPNDFEQAI